MVMSMSSKHVAMADMAKDPQFDYRVFNNKWPDDCNVARLRSNERLEAYLTNHFKDLEAQLYPGLFDRVEIYYPKSEWSKRHFKKRKKQKIYFNFDRVIERKLKNDLYHAELQSLFELENSNGWLEFTIEFHINRLVSLNKI